MISGLKSSDCEIVILIETINEILPLILKFKKRNILSFIFIFMQKKGNDFFLSLPADFSAYKEAYNFKTVFFSKFFKLFQILIRIYRSSPEYIRFESTFD